MRRPLSKLNGHKLVIVFIIAIALFGAAFFFRARQTAAADLSICRAQQQDRNVLRSILILARDGSRRRGISTPSAEAFYAEALRLAKPINCQGLPSQDPLP